MGERKIYRRLVAVDEVLKLVEEAVPLRPRGEERLPIREAVGRVLSRNVYARTGFPPYTRSLVDGYAVHSADLEGVYEDRPARLRLVGRVKTGDTEAPEIGRGECAEVSTGAIVPYPADAVVPVEYTSEEDSWVTVYRSVRHSENIDIAGSDVVEGEVIAWRGEEVTPLVVSAAAAVGVEEFWVYRRPRVAVIPTGNELRPLGSTLEYGQVYDSNSHMVYSLVKLMGGEPRIYGPARDSYEEIKAVVDEALQWADIVATIGGTSAGLEDYVHRVFDSYTPGVILHGVRQKPGRPLVVAAADEKILVGLPGFPLSCLVSSHLYLAPLISRLHGRPGPAYPEEEVIVSTPLRGQPGITMFVPAVTARRRGETLAFPLPGHSGRIASLTMIDGFIRIGPRDEYLPQGSRAAMLRPLGLRRYELNLIGSHCPLLQDLASRAGGGRIRVVSTGSRGGLQALRSGVADMAGTHLLDPSTGEYNVAAMREMGLTADKGFVLVRGYLREQGFVYRRGEPVSSMTEVADRSLRFVNRNPGSGTRLLIDSLIEREAAELGVDPGELRGRIRGYSFEVKNHDTVAYLIARGVADVGVALRYVAEKYGLGFTPIVEERYDVAARMDAVAGGLGGRLVELLRDLPKGPVAGYSGYRADGETGKLIEVRGR